MSSFDFRTNRGKSPVVVIAVTLIAVGMIACAVLIQFGLFDLNNGTMRQDLLQARQLAKAGADATAGWIADQSASLDRQAMDDLLKTLLATDNGKSQPASLPGFEEGTFTVQLSGTEKVLHIVATGMYHESTETYRVEMNRNEAGVWEKK